MTKAIDPALRGEVAVVTAIAMRQDGTLTALLVEIRAMQSRYSHFNRVRGLETQP